MTNPFILATPAEEKEMLAACGAESIDQIFSDQIPAEYAWNKTFGLPPALSELEIQRELGALAATNRNSTDTVSFLGGGIYDHFCPAAVGAIANRSEFVTSYTPYQPEASQGTLQAFFEFQSLVTRLFATDVSNASLYDGATALGESLFMALGARPDRSTILVSETVHPDSRALAATYLKHFDVKLVTVPQSGGTTDLAQLKEAIGPDTAAVVLQHPNYFGCLEEAEEVAKLAHEAGALLISICDPISLGLLAPPGEYDADIAIAEGQCLGLREFGGGETLGLFTCKKEHVRRVPGRLVGIAKDKYDRQGFVLTLQTREQHIRRDKATSNICTNHAHNALRATIFLCLMGPQGMEHVARMSARNTARLRDAIVSKAPKAIAFEAPCFKEFVVRTKLPAIEVCRRALEKNFFAGVPLGHLGPGFENHLLVCATEKRTDAEIDQFSEVLAPCL
ncbi:MAG: aminomethyl-transferring glycine dehydrogenase subunit GcvPA [Candidatus Sumerlaeaceae bacterium]|nr:aminomethyl-transferring glycine dehydrogenase subunit GcvPA [Candidatus Sumerlaeaceae bacterium]